MRRVHSEHFHQNHASAVWDWFQSAPAECGAFPSKLLQPYFSDRRPPFSDHCLCFPKESVFPCPVLLCFFYSGWSFFDLLITQVSSLPGLFLSCCFSAIPPWQGLNSLSLPCCKRRTVSPAFPHSGLRLFWNCDE